MLIIPTEQEDISEGFTDLILIELESYVSFAIGQPYGLAYAPFSTPLIITTNLPHPRGYHFPEICL